VTEAVVWTSSNDSVASVGANTGTVRAGSVGTAIITGRLANDPASAVGIEVSVVEKHKVLLVKVDPPTPRIALGQNLKLKAQVTMADGQINGNVSWSSSDDTIAVINPTTGEVSGLREGKVTIVAAYSADPRYKGLSEVEVVKELKATPTPAPSDVVFRPGATPMPASPTPRPTETPATKPTQTAGLTPSTDSTTGGEDTIGSTTGSGVSFTPPVFSAIRTFTSEAVFRFIDYRNIVVAEGTKLTISTNAGKNWTVYNDVGSQPIRTMYWLSASEGWLGGDNGTILKVSINDGKISSSVQDSGTTAQITSIRFTSATDGIFSALYEGVKRTADGGATWGDPISMDNGKIYNDGLGGVTYFASERIYRYENGGMRMVEIDDQKTFRGYEEGYDTMPGLIPIKVSNTKWFYTKDWNTFGEISSSLKTSTQIIRDGIRWITPISDSTLMANLDRECCSYPYYVLSRDGGKLWSDPKKLTVPVENIVAFSESQMWGFNGSQLYRAGTP
jgi:hypothetical protein